MKQLIDLKETLKTQESQIPEFVRDLNLILKSYEK
jgi:hypothetical protein